MKPITRYALFVLPFDIAVLLFIVAAFCVLEDYWIEGDNTPWRSPLIRAMGEHAADIVTCLGAMATCRMLIAWKRK